METLVIETKERLYAQKVNPRATTEQKTAWFGKQTEPLQGSVMNYPIKTEFRTHRHILNPRIINRTQEVFIVVEGEIQVDIFESNSFESVDHLGSLTAKAGEAIFVWAGYHKITLKGIAYEIKAGQFNGIISEDKEFLDA